MLHHVENKLKPLEEKTLANMPEVERKLPVYEGLVYASWTSQSTSFSPSSTPQRQQANISVPSTSYPSSSSSKPKRRRANIGTSSLPTSQTSHPAPTPSRSTTRPLKRRKKTKQPVTIHWVECEECFKWRKIEQSWEESNFTCVDLNIECTEPCDCEEECDH